jgi:hypothetical protein
MGSLGEAVLDLTADSSKIDSGLNEGKGKVTSALDGLKGVFGEATGTMLGQLSAGALRDVGQGIISVGKDIVGSALDAQQAQAQLEAVITSTGGAAGISAAQANEYAESLSKITMFDKEAVLGGESMLLTFTNIGKDVFPDATTAILNMSQALGQDLKSSSIQLGKALNNPVEGVSALQRVGVTFTDEQKKVIQSLVDTGDVAGAQRVILAELNKEFGGSAKAAGEAYGGQLAILGNQFKEVKEDAGTAFLPVLKDLVSIAKEMMPYLSQAVKWFASLPTPVKTGAVALLALVAVAAPLIGIIASIISVVTVLGPVLAGIGAALPIILAVVAAAALLYVAWQTNFGGIRDVVSTFVTIVKNLWQALLAFLRGDTTAAFGFLKQAFQAELSLIELQFGRIGTTIRNIWNGLTTFLRTVWQAVWSAIVSYVQGKVNEAISTVTNLITRIKSAFNINWAELGKKIIDGLINGLKNGVKAVTDTAMSVAKAALDGAKKVLGIKSPSTAFAEIGQFSGMGFSQGFQRTLTPQSIAGSLNRVVAGAAQTMNRSMQNTVNVYNPSPEPASKSVDSTLRKLSYLGVIK